MLPESVLAASWLGCMLFVVEIVLCIRYFSKFSGHSRFNLLVGFLVGMAILTVIVTCAHSWKLLITHRVTPPKRHSWPIPMIIICKNITGTVCQCFLAYRYYGLSRSIFITVSIVLVVIIHLGAGFTIAIDYLVHPQFNQPIPAHARPIWFCIAAALDIVIPMLLIYELRQIKTIYSTTRSFIHRLIVNAASSGCVPALVEIFVLVLFWTQPHLILLGCNFVAPCYGITVLINLFICQSKVPSAAAMQTKTANLTTLDSVQLDVPTHRGRLGDIQESSETSGIQSTDCSLTQSPGSEKF